MLRSATRKVAASGAVASTSQPQSLFAVKGIFDAGLVDGVSIIIIFDVFVEGDSDASEGVDNGDERTPV